MKYFLVYYDSGGDREDCSVFYCELIQSNSNIDALDLYFKKFEILEEDKRLFHAIEKKLLTK